MKKNSKFFAYAVCILLSVVIACTTLMVGAAGTAAESTTYSKPTGNDLLYTEESIPTEKDITDTISEIVSENGWEDDLSEFGNEVSEFSKESESFLSSLIAKIEAAIERLTEFLKQVFKIGVFD